jgi:hypothetical protein
VSVLATIVAYPPSLLAFWHVEYFGWGFGE